MPKAKTDGPNTVSAAYKSMHPVWNKIEDVLGGTRAMRAAGRTHLPQHPKEKDTHYRTRLNTSILVNIAQLTLDSWVGRPFSEPVEVSENTSPAIKEILDDVDLRGNAIGVFARDWFRAGLAKGFAHVLVDFPSPSLGEVRTIADDHRENLRPYWSFIRPENLIFATAAVRNGREFLTHVRIRETEVTRDGWAERVTHRIRVFDADPNQGTVVFSIWQQGGKEDEWEKVVPETPLDVDEIPLVTFYAGDREGLMLAKPPLEDLVDLNIAHWQSEADQRHALTVARFPILAASGVSDESTESMVLAPNRTLTTPDPSGKWYYVEHGGAALQAGERDLDKLEALMAHYGAEFLRRRPGRETATARALDSAETTSPLEDAAIRFNDALARAMAITGKWLGEEDPGTVRVSVDLGPDAAEQADFDLLKTARQQRDISRETFLREMVRRGTLADDFDSDADLSALEAEAMTGEASIDIDEQAEQ